MDGPLLTKGELMEEKLQTWAKKYPILVRYQSRVNIPYYAARLNAMLEELRREYGFDEQDAMLVLKDILAQVWKSRKKQK
jgi:hypothetical protein